MKDIPISPRIALMKRNRRIRRLRISLLFFILFLTTLFALSYFSSHPNLTIDKIVINGNSIIETSNLNSKIKEKLSGKYLRLFSRSNFLIYPHDEIYNSLLTDFPRIETLSIKRQGLKTLNVDITERGGSYLYCGISIPENKKDIGENCYFVNNDGYIFDKAPYFSGDVYFKFYTNIVGDSFNPTRNQMIEKNHFHNIIRFVDSIASLGFSPSYLAISSDNVYSLYLKSKGSSLNPKIIFKGDNDLNVILDSLSSAMKEKEFANEINSKYDSLSYIDLRFKNKVLYKFQ